MIKALVASSIKNLILIGNYRDNEIIDGYELVNFLQHVKKINVSTIEIKLKNIDYGSITEFLSDALSVSVFESYTLAVFIHKKQAATLSL